MPSNDDTRDLQTPHNTPDPDATRARSSGAAPAGALVIPGYDLMPEIARGGMGVVYAARDLAFGREVAVKVMLPGMSADEFVREARITGRLPHPGIPPVHALGELPDGRPFLAMKLIRGDTLDKVLKARADLTADRGKFLAAFEQMCHAVGYAHAQGIIHRDLKPSNIMVGAFGEVQVMDWGLAKELRDAEPELTSNAVATEPEDVVATVAGQIKGTPAYMAPEQARGEAVDARADVFALGGLLTTILTGKPPFAGDSVLDMIRRAANADLSDAFARLDACGADAELVTLARQCLAAQTGDRPTGATELALAVASYRAEVEERLRRAERERAAAEAKAEEQRKRRRVQHALTATILMLLASGVGFLWWQREQTNAQKLADERTLAEQQRIEAEAKGRLEAAQESETQRARDGVQANLKLAVDLRRQYRFKAAGDALTHAAKLAERAPETRPVVEQAQRDLAFVVSLDDIRYRKWWTPNGGPYGGGGFDMNLAPKEYPKAFADYGLDVTQLSPKDASKRIVAGGITADIVAAVDDWALYERNDLLQLRLLEIARLTDPGDWTNQLRDPALRKNKAALAALAAKCDLTRTTPAAVSVLAMLMQRQALNPSAFLISSALLLFGVGSI